MANAATFSKEWKFHLKLFTDTLFTNVVGFVSWNFNDTGTASFYGSKMMHQAFAFHVILCCKINTFLYRR